MDEIKMRNMLKKLYGYLALGILDIVALLLYSFIFPGAKINTSIYSKLGLIIILVFGIFWLLFFFVFLASKRAKDFTLAYQKYSSKKKRTSNI